jgi:EAL domain-containing protein (putative c-di-GMP-specific phosphodiesterase class I)
VRLALDDFGTGYSSLTYLQRFKFDRLKIDRAFVRPLGKVRGSEAIIQAIVALGRALDIRIMAEGVETEEQRVLLRLAGCEEMQGFLFARPGPREAIDRLLAAAESSGPRSILRAAPLASA